VFKSANRGQDEQVDFWVEYDLPSYFKELAVRDPHKHWMSSGHFIWATCFCLTWPYRWLLNSSKSEYHYRVVKKVTTTRPPMFTPSEPEQPLVEVTPVTPPPPYEE